MDLKHILALRTGSAHNSVGVWIVLCICTLIEIQNHFL